MMHHTKEIINNPMGSAPTRLHYVVQAQGLVRLLNVVWPLTNR